MMYTLERDGIYVDSWRLVRDGEQIGFVMMPLRSEYGECGSLLTTRYLVVSRLHYGSFVEMPIPTDHFGVIDCKQLLAALVDAVRKVFCDSMPVFDWDML